MESQRIQQKLVDGEQIGQQQKKARGWRADWSTKARGWRADRSKEEI